MPQIQFHLNGFQPVLGPQLQLACEWVDLLWAAVTVGRRDWHHVVMHGMYSMYEMVYRGCLLFANLAEAPADHITRSNAYNALDPSEKGAVSYFMGLTLSKLFAEHVLNAPWMMHLDVYFNQLQPMIGNGKRRPDLVGQDSHGRWIVAESKGRTNGFDPNTLATAKQQTASIRRVAGQVPYLKFALVSHFSAPSEYLAAHCLDPEETDEEASDLVIERDQFFDDYYEPFLNLVGDQPALRTDVSARIPELDMTIGIAASTYQLVRRKAYGELGSHLSDLRVRETTSRRKTGTDGVVIELGSSWFSADGSLVLPARK